MKDCATLSESSLCTALRPLQREVQIIYDALSAVVELPGHGGLLDHAAVNIQSQHHGSIAAHCDVGSKTLACTAATSAPRCLTVLPKDLWVHSLGPNDVQFLDGSAWHAILKWSARAAGAKTLRCEHDNTAFRYSATFFARNTKK